MERLLHILRMLPVLLALALFAPEGAEIAGAIPIEAAAAKSRKKRKTSKRKTASSKKRGGKRKSGSKRRKGKRNRLRAASVQTVWSNASGTEWIHRGGRGIIVSRDSAGTVRAMLPCTLNPHLGRDYASAINSYATELKDDPVRVYMLIAPSQGEFYMPERTSTRGAERRCVVTAASSLTKDVVPVMVFDTLARHTAEEIYNRTDHHWSPLGAYYAASALAEAAGVRFLPLSDYRERRVGDYVGTMYKFSGDAEVKRAPEEFVYYLPPEGYEAEFIDYRLSGGSTVGESAMHKADFFRHFPDGSAAAYSTFMGGDPHTVKVSHTGGTSGRRLLIVKDSYGNAMAPCLFGSFEEVHVVDFRYFPHNLIDYVRKNGITDLAFVNCLQLAFAPSTASRLRKMYGHHHLEGVASASAVESVEDDEAPTDFDGAGFDNDTDDDDDGDDPDDDGPEEEEDSYGDEDVGLDETYE